MTTTFHLAVCVFTCCTGEWLQALASSKGTFATVATAPDAGLLHAIGSSVSCHASADSTVKVTNTTISAVAWTFLEFACASKEREIALTF